MSAKNHIDLLGRTAKDRVTGFTGVVVTISFDLFGCVQAILSPPVNKDGKKEDGHWFDVNRLELQGKSRKMPVPEFGDAPAEFGATPQTHSHGPAEKPAGRLK
jgi:hypothetical protein